MLARRKRFYDHQAYPELAAVSAEHAVILSEARTSLDALHHKMAGRKSYLLPLIPEAEDRHVLADPVWAAARELSPRTCELLTSIPYVVAFAYSTLAAGENIAMHEHHNPYLIASLCLDDGGGSYMRVGGERRDFRSGELMVFDYTHPHEAKNEGERDRIVLLISIDPRRANRLRRSDAGEAGNAQR